MSKQLLFSLTKKDFEIETFRSGGKGGQHQNKTESGVRIRHLASGAVGESRDERSQHQNKQNAFKRLITSKEFQLWHKLECGRRLGTIGIKTQEQIEKEVDDSMNPANLKIEFFDPASERII